MAEERGFESLFFPEHTHIPVEPRDALPRRRRAAARVQPHRSTRSSRSPRRPRSTERIKLGTGVCLVIERDPIVTAKEVASLDQLSGGRFLFGVGAGWNREEMRNHGTDPSTRFRRMRERVEAMKAIWTQDEAEYHGRIVDFDPIWSWPKPVQKPHPPVLVGGLGDKVLDRVRRLRRRVDPEPGAASRRSSASGSQSSSAARGGRPRPRSRCRSSAPSPSRALLERLRTAGVDALALLPLARTSPDEVERQLDELAEVAAAWAG